MGGFGGVVSVAVIYKLVRKYFNTLTTVISVPVLINEYQACQYTKPRKCFEITGLPLYVQICRHGILTKTYLLAKGRQYKLICVYVCVQSQPKDQSKEQFSFLFQLHGSESHE